jgi:DNA repair exonuclease SbcCD ATPase subunit
MADQQPDPFMTIAAESPTETLPNPPLEHEFLPEQLLDDLTASMELIQHQAERIAQLERALDQTLVQVQDVRSQLVRQEWIEEQLAATEEFANVQQQAILHLKGRIAGRSEEDLEPVKPVQAEPVATPSARLEVRYVQAQQQIQALSQKLREESIQSAVLPEMTEAEREEAWWREQLMTLEAELAKHLQTQAFLQQACSEMEQDHDQDQRRILELENQSAEMQEQILRQAQQTSEYETAIQHWKDRFYQLQNQMLSILELYDQLSEPIPDAIAQLLAQLPQPTPSEQMQSLRRALPRRSDLPEFLQRRRGTR